MRLLARRDCIDLPCYVRFASVDLVVADPPYNSGRDWAAFDDRFGPPDDAELHALPSDLRDLVHLAGRVHSESMAGYLCFMAARLAIVARVMKPSASIYVFCDDAANGYLRLAMDSIFGPRRFCNELVWKRSQANNLPGSKWKRDADRMLFYRGPGFTWNQCWLPHDPEYVRQHYKPLSCTKEENTGRPGRKAAVGGVLMPEQLAGAIKNKQHDDRLATSTKALKSNTLDGQARVRVADHPTRGGTRSKKANPVRRVSEQEATSNYASEYDPGKRAKRNTAPFLGVSPPPGRAWRWKRETMERLHADGRLMVSPTGKSLRYIRFLDETPGQRHGSVFLDDPPPSAKEYRGWPTAKPESLTRKLIEASSNPGDLVLDPFMGSGTTCAVAEQLGRQWAGFDRQPDAVRIARERLAAECHHLFGGDVEVVE